MPPHPQSLALPPVALNEMVANLIKFLLLMHPAKELTSRWKC